MSRKCDVCGKSPQVGYNVSHSHLKTKKRWKPNVKKVKVVEQGRVVSRNVCSRCLRDGKVSKPRLAPRKQATA